MSDNAIGFSINIPEKLLQDIEKVDRAISNLATTTENTRQKLNKSFSDLANDKGLNALLTKIGEINASLSKVGEIKVDSKNFNKVATQFQAITTAAEKLTQIIPKLNEMKLSNGSVGGSTQITASVDEVIKLTNALNTLKSLRSSMNEKEVGKDQQALAYAAKRTELAELLAEQRNYQRQLVETDKSNALASKQRIEQEKTASMLAIQAEKERQVQIQRSLQEIKRLAKAYKSMPTSIDSKGAGKIVYQSMNAKTINQRLTAIHNLKNALKDLDTTDNRYAATVKRLNLEIQNQQKELRRLGVEVNSAKKSHSQLMNIADQVERKLSAVFGVTAIMGYVNKLVSVTGQFEIMQTSIETILQDKDMANELWSKTVQLAVKSPFTIKELIGYTKQLAAYRIESDKLYETNKMLADVSAGLGVDMQRLILAYGQVKAANYLRGCLGKGTKIQMFNGGVKNVEDIIVGDVILGDDNTERVVSEIIRGREQMYKVCSKDGVFNEYRVNENHILTLFDKEIQDNVDVYVSEYLDNPNRFLGATQNGVYDIVVTKDIVDGYYGFVIDKNKRFVIENGIITHNTELRQFTEAGVNMLDELAKHFENIEGRFVSVAEVFDKISKRQVTFGDVEQVFKNITSEGGIFYQMQEKQAETLRGRIMNLKDSIDLMMYDIGQSHHGIISGLISLIKNLVDNWRVFAPVVTFIASLIATKLIGKALIPLGTMLATATRAILNLIPAFHRGAVAARTFGTATASITKVNPWLALIQVVVALGMAIWEASTNSTKFASEMNKIDVDMSGRLQESIEGYYRLTGVLRTASEGSKEYEDALSKLSTQYKELLPDKYLDIEAIKTEEISYENVTKALRQYYDQKALATKEDKIEELYGADIIEAQNKYIKGLELIAIMEGNMFPADFALFKAEMPKIINQIVEDVKRGDVSVQNFASTLKQTFKNKQDGGNLEIFDGADISFLTEALEKYVNARKNLTGLPDMATANLTFRDTDKYNKLSKEYENFVEGIDKILNRAQELVNRQDGVNLWKIFSKFYPDADESSSYIQELKSKINELNDLLDGTAVNFAEKNSEIKKQMLEWFRDNSKIISDLETTANQSTQTTRDWLDNFVEHIKDSEKELENTELQKKWFDVIDDIAKTNNVNVGIFNGVIPTATQTLDDYTKVVKGKLDNLKDVVKSYSKAMQSSFGTIFAPLILAKNDFKSIDEVNKAVMAFEQLYKSLGGSDTNTSRNGRTTNDIYSRRIKLIQDMRKAYEDLNKTFSGTETAQKILESFATEAKALGIAIDSMDLSTPESYIDALRQIENLVKKDAKAYKEWQKAIRDANLEIEKTDMVAADERLKSQIEELFEGYKLSLELDKIGVSSDVAESLFGIEAFDIDALRKEVSSQLGGNLFSIVVEMQQIENAYKGSEEALNQNKHYLELQKEANEKYSQDDIKLAKETAKKITGIEEQEQETRLKKYLEYGKKSVSERAKILLDAQQKLQEIEKTFVPKTSSKVDIDINEANKKRAIESVKKEMDELINKLSWDEFKNSDIFISLFNDLDNASEALIQHTLKNLENFKKAWSDLPVDQMKEVISKINDLESQLAKINPFSAYKKTIDEIKTAMKSGVEDENGDLFGFSSIDASKLFKIGIDNDMSAFMDAVELEIMALSDQLSINRESLATYETLLTLKQQGKSYDESGLELSAEQVEIWEQGKEELSNQVDKLKNQNSTTSKLISLWTKIFGKQETTITALKEQENVLQSIIKMADDLYDAFKGLGEALGLDEDSPAYIFAEMGKNMMDTILQTILLQIQLKAAQVEAEGLGKAMNTAMGVVGWIVMGVQILTQALSAIFATHDKYIERQIDREKDKVGELEKAFEKLQKTLERSFSTTYLKSTYDEANRNLEEQINAYQRMINLEYDKKRTDEDAIKDYIDEKNRLIEEQRELLEEEVENLGGTYDVRSTTREFIDAWVDAFEETGNGLNGLKENFSEFFRNILLEQAVMSGAGAIMKPLLDKINESLEDDFEISEGEYADIEKMQGVTLDRLNEFMQGWYSKWGEAMTDSATLSGLQKGIQGITEEQADILAAYWNSVRFYTANIDATLTKLANEVFSETGESPMITQLKIIATNTAEMRDTLIAIANSWNSILAPHPTESGRGLKVII